MSDIQKGCQITSAFHYIQQVFRECQRLISKIDNQMDPEWVVNVLGNTITRGVSVSLEKPEEWIVKAVLRVYRNNSKEPIDKSIKGIIITFWGDKVEQPIITAGKLIYSNIANSDPWDLWNIWFEWLDKNKNHEVLDGTDDPFCPEKYEYIDETQFFSLPLVSITDDEVLMEKIIQPLKEL